MLYVPLFLFVIAVVTSSEKRRLIADGLTTSTSKFPYLAALVVAHDLSMPFCTGAFIDPQIVITAAHCVPNMEFSQFKRIRVLIRVDRCAEAKDGARVRAVRRASFSGDPLLGNDVALLFLEKSSNLIQMHEVLQLPKYPPVVGEVLVTLGFGKNKRVPQHICLQENELRVTVAPLLSGQTCFDALFDSRLIRSMDFDLAHSRPLRLKGWAADRPGNFSSPYGVKPLGRSVLCTQPSPTILRAGSMPGDSGGPVVRIKGDTHELIGVTSFGISYAFRSPDYFTGVGSPGILSFLQLHLSSVRAGKIAAPGKSLPAEDEQERERESSDLYGIDFSRLVLKLPELPIRLWTSPQISLKEADRRRDHRWSDFHESFRRQDGGDPGGLLVFPLTPNKFLPGSHECSRAAEALDRIEKEMEEGTEFTLSTFGEGMPQPTGFAPGIVDGQSRRLMLGVQRKKSLLCSEENSSASKDAKRVDHDQRLAEVEDFERWSPKSLSPGVSSFPSAPKLNALSSNRDLMYAHFCHEYLLCQRTEALLYASPSESSRSALDLNIPETSDVISCVGILSEWFLGELMVQYVDLFTQIYPEADFGWSTESLSAYERSLQREQSPPLPWKEDRLRKSELLKEEGGAQGEGGWGWEPGAALVVGFLGGFVGLLVLSAMTCCFCAFWRKRGTRRIGI